MPRNSRSEAHKAIYALMNMPLTTEKVKAECVRALGLLEVQYAKLTLARFQARQRREKAKANDPSRYRL